MENTIFNFIDLIKKLRKLYGNTSQEVMYAWTINNDTDLVEYCKIMGVIK